MAKINIKSIANKVSKSPKVINKMEQIVNIRVENAKRMMVEDFENDENESKKVKRQENQISE